MTVKTVEGNKAVAEAALNCSPDVAACYPITPSTGIAEQLAKYYADGLLKSYITVESEFSAISALVGASAAGARTFTATSSQGLLLMHEVLFNASGMRLPIVMAVANRAVSAPLSIWNDSQDTIAQRDAGWIQLYARDNQDAVDSIPQAFKVAEATNIPAMVCVDGYYLTHSIEQIDIPSKDEVAKFLPKFKPKFALDPTKPLSLGVYATPSYYQGFREDFERDMLASKKAIASAGKEFASKFSRPYGLVESFECDDAKFVLVGMGSMMTNAKLVVEELRRKGEKVGLLRVRSFRPFPEEEVGKALEGKIAGVLEKDISPGGAPALYAEVLAATRDSNAIVSSFTGGLGGKEIGRREVRAVLESLKKRGAKKPVREWM